MSTSKLALVLYSNPADTDRLRLDREHRAVDEVLSKASYPRDSVTRLHATRLDDVVSALKGCRYDVIQFSGHGSASGFVLESETGASQTVAAQTLANIIAAVCDRVRVILCMSCFSSDAAQAFVAAAEYVVTSNGILDDESAISFVKTFYDCYIEDRSVEGAFFVARMIAATTKSELDVVLWRNRPGSDRVQAVVTAFAGGQAILVSISEEAAADIRALGLDETHVLGNLARKLRVHRWIFSTPRERVLLALGRYIGMFSWEDERTVTCQRLMQIAPNVDEETTGAFVDLTIRYADLLAAYYRTASAFDPKLRAAVKHAIDEHRGSADFVFGDTPKAHALRALVPDEFKLAKAIAIENINVAERKFHRDAHGEAASHLEAALSAIHDLIEAAAERISRHGRAAH